MCRAAHLYRWYAPRTYDRRVRRRLIKNALATRTAAASMTSHEGSPPASTGLDVTGAALAGTAVAWGGVVGTGTAVGAAATSCVGIGVGGAGTRVASGVGKTRARTGGGSAALRCAWRASGRGLDGNGQRLQGGRGGLPVLQKLGVGQLEAIAEAARKRRVAVDQSVRGEADDDDWLIRWRRRGWVAGQRSRIEPGNHGLAEQHTPPDLGHRPSRRVARRATAAAQRSRRGPPGSPGRRPARRPAADRPTGRRPRAPWSAWWSPAWTLRQAHRGAARSRARPANAPGRRRAAPGSAVARRERPRTASA